MAPAVSAGRKIRLLICAIAMTEQSINPFLSFAKSNDLTNDQINDLWVGFDKPPGAHPLFNPASPMATVVLGGKGSGKTHLFRYFSYPVQTKQDDYTSGDWLSAISKDGYVGIYTRVSGLNCSRFSGKGVGQDRWKEIFRYYVELWLGQELLDVVSPISDHVGELSANEAEIVAKFTECIDVPATHNISTFSGFSNFLRESQRSLDRAVNQAAFSRDIDADLRCSPGDVVFGLPKALAPYFGGRDEVIFAYYLDECENLLEYQQKHVNTLLRDRERPVTFRVGARSYGMRTYDTDSAEGEQIREDSEYESLQLDQRMRGEGDRYGAFARELLALRVAVRRSMLGATDVDARFPSYKANKLAVRGADDLPHIATLRKRLASIDVALADDVVAALRFDEDPIVEKAAIFLFYQAIARGRSDLRPAAKEIGLLVEDYRSGGRSNRIASAIGHRRGDFMAQIRRSLRQHNASGEDDHYTGLNEFIRMSEGLPRSLLTIVGESVKSAAFRREILGSSPISESSQYEGVKYASDWFYSDVPQGGEAGKAIQLSVSRLGELFRMNRFADKPVECSLIAFSVCTEAISQQARDVLREAERRSFLIKMAKPQNDRSSTGVWDKYHLNRILCPRFDLPLGVRGVARLRVEAIESIFATQDDSSFRNVRDHWKENLNWPFGRKDLGSGGLDSGELF